MGDHNMPDPAGLIEKIREAHTTDTIDKPGCGKRATIFKINDQVKSIALGDDRRWRGIVVEVGVGQVKLRRSSDKKGKDKFWVTTNNLVIV
jgi:hypothetical protein